MTKYQDLQQKFERNQKQYKKYEQDCRKFIADFRTALANSLECPIEKLSWIPFSVEFMPDYMRKKRIVGISLERDLILYEDGFYAFNFALARDNLTPGYTEPAEGLIIHFLVKKDGSKFTLCQLNEMITVDPDDLRSHAEQFLSKLEEDLDSEFQILLKDEKKRQIGFVAKL